MIKMIATDLDGTLLKPKKPYRIVAKKKRKLLADFYSKGGQVALVSSRGPIFCQLVAKKLRIPCSIVACGGTYVQTDGKIIYSNELPNSIARDIARLAIANQKKPAIIVTTDDYRLIAKSWKFSIIEKLIFLVYRIKSGRYLENIKYKNEIFDEFILQERGVLKLFLLLPKFFKNDPLAMYNLIKDKYQDQVTINVMKHGIEILPKNVDKGIGLEMIQQQKQLSVDELVVVGDDGNDIPMFEKYPNSFILKHGLDEAKVYAKYEIKKFKHMYNYVKEINSTPTKDCEIPPNN
jgi:Cof subfamily protein (haloacid dehalogenase superfamily)